MNLAVYCAFPQMCHNNANPSTHSERDVIYGRHLLYNYIKNTIGMKYNYV